MRITTTIKLSDDLELEVKGFYTPEDVRYDSIGVLNIYPITSKKEVGRCLIEIPVEEIDDLIEILKKIK